MLTTTTALLMNLLCDHGLSWHEACIASRQTHVRQTEASRQTDRAGSDLCCEASLVGSASAQHDVGASHIPMDDVSLMHVGQR